MEKRMMWVKPGTLRVKPGTLMVMAPQSGVDESKCFVCTGPKPRSGREHYATKEAFVVGLVAGIDMMLGGYRPVLCVAHETQFREILVNRLDVDAPTLQRLGIDFKVAGEEEDLAQADSCIATTLEVIDE